MCEYLDAEIQLLSVQLHATLKWVKKNFMSVYNIMGNACYCANIRVNVIQRVICLHMLNFVTKCTSLDD